MGIMSSLDCETRGITLNDQQIRLFKLLEEDSKQTKKKIYEYLEEYHLARNKSK